MKSSAHSNHAMHREPADRRDDSRQPYQRSRRMSRLDGTSRATVHVVVGRLVRAPALSAGTGSIWIEFSSAVRATPPDMFLRDFLAHFAPPPAPVTPPRPDPCKAKWDKTGASGGCYHTLPAPPSPLSAVSVDWALPTQNLLPIDHSREAPRQPKAHPEKSLLSPERPLWPTTQNLRSHAFSATCPFLPFMPPQGTLAVWRT